MKMLRTAAVAVLMLFLCMGCAQQPHAMQAGMKPAVRAAAPTAADIEQLITQAKPYSTVYLPKGRLVVSHGLIIGGKRQLRIIAPAGFVLLCRDLNSPVLTITHCTGITLIGGSFAHLKPPGHYECNAGVLFINHCQHIVIRDARLHGCGAIGVDAEFVKGIEVIHCLLYHNSWTAIYLRACRGVKIWDNIIKQNANELQTQGVGEVDFSGNLIKDNGGYWRKLPKHPGP